MVFVKKYQQIHSELTQRRSEATSALLCDALDRAIALTEQSRQCLDKLSEQRDLLLADIPSEPPLQGDIIQTAAAAIAADEEFEAALREDLRLALREKPPSVEIDFTVPEGASPELRDLMTRLQKHLRAADELPKRDPDTIRQEILQVQRHKQLVTNTAVNAIQLASASRSTLKAIYAAGNLWLTHVLINQIYDKRDVEFETTLRSEQSTEALSWIAGQILGFIPLVGIAVEFLDLVRSLTQARSRRWINADSTFVFLENYEQALKAWSDQCREYLKRATKALSQLAS